MTILSIEGADWEGYKYFNMEFSKGTNTIIGLSHYGKSSIVRALNWVLENRPQGTPYFPHGNKNPSTEICLTFEDHTHITRIRNGSVNLYEVYGKDEPFTALRSGVPDEVRESSNMLERNIQSQKDVHFFLTETPGKRAKMLNEVANLEEMDIAMDIINKNVSEIRSEYTVKTKLLNQYEQEVADLKWVSMAMAESNAITALKNQVEDYKTDKSDISKILDDIDFHLLEISRLPNVSAIEEIDSIIKFDQKLEKLENKEEELVTIIKTLKNDINSVNRVILPETEELTSLEAFTDEIEGIKTTLTAIKKILKETGSLCLDFLKAENESDTLETLFSKTLADMGICPLCGK